MRALRSVLGPADANDVWQSFLLATIATTPMPDVWLFGEPYPALNAVMLTPAEHAQLVRLTTTFGRVFEKAIAALASDADALLRLGFPWLAIELLRQEPEHSTLRLGRFDFLLDRGGQWQLLEYNADTPSGVRETVKVESLIARHLAPHVGDLLMGSSRHLRRELQRSFGDVLGLVRRRASSSDKPTLGIVTDAGYGEDLAQGAFLTQTLSSGRVGHAADVILGDIHNLYLSRDYRALYQRCLLEFRYRWQHLSRHRTHRSGRAGSRALPSWQRVHNHQQRFLQHESRICDPGGRQSQ